ncbi:MAG: GAF domain-containing protein [Anaerolineae bacterium]|nr:GAF domain-containing protein [Anaerolineae bacterium]
MDKTDQDLRDFQPLISPLEDVRVWQDRLIRAALRILVVAGPLAAIAGSVYDFSQGVYWSIPLYWLAYGIMAVIAFWRRVPYSWQVAVIMCLVYGLAIMDFVSDGRQGNGRVFLLVLPFMASVFLGLQEAILSVTLVPVTMLGMGWALSTGRIPTAQPAGSTNVIGWVTDAVVMTMVSAFIVVAQNEIVPRLVGALGETRSLATQLEEQRRHLEAEVIKRTADLAQRNIQLRTAAQVAREAVVLQDVDTLLDEVAHLVSDRFGFYHSGIFLLDKQSGFAVLCAASSEGGQRMLARAHKLKLGVGLVGHVAAHGEHRIALDVGTDSVYFDNPDLPETRSEIALPLQARGEIIGVLDVQSREAGAFGQEDVVVLQVLADQIAVAIANARLFEQLQQSLEAERRAYGRLSLADWQRLSRARHQLAQRYDPQGILAGDGEWREEMDSAVQHGTPVSGELDGMSTLAMPLQVRGQVIGVLDAYKPKDAGGWTGDEVALLQTLVDQLGIALESARLYQETQRRASREQAIRQITENMRRSVDIETILQSTVTELAKALGAPRAYVRLGTEEQLRGRAPVVAPEPATEDTPQHPGGGSPDSDGSKADD